MNQFARLLAEIPDRQTLLCLQAIATHRGISVEQIRERAYLVRVGPHLAHLLRLGLVASRGGGGWEATWLGHGVYRWEQQVLWAEAQGQATPEPRTNENGRDVLPVCDAYRPTYLSPGYCWCGNPHQAHAGYAVSVAQDLLCHERQKALIAIGSGRRVQDLLQALEPTELLVLTKVYVERFFGVSIAGISSVSIDNPAVGLSETRAAVARLAELRLILDDGSGSYWFPTWDGIGVVNWFFQQGSAAHRRWEPRAGENGDNQAPEPCDEFREMIGDPGHCWCCHPAWAHRESQLREA